MGNFLDLSKFKASSVGTTVDSPPDKLKIDFDYSTTGWFFITIMGTTWHPKKVTFTCLQSGEVFETLTDSHLIQYYMTYRKV